MARTVAELPPGIRITDYISLGMLARAFPVEKVRSAVPKTEPASAEPAICCRR